MRDDIELRKAIRAYGRQVSESSLVRYAEHCENVMSIMAEVFRKFKLGGMIPAMVEQELFTIQRNYGDEKPVILLHKDCCFLVQRSNMLHKWSGAFGIHPNQRMIQSEVHPALLMRYGMIRVGRQVIDALYSTIPYAAVCRVYPRRSPVVDGKCEVTGAFDCLLKLIDAMVNDVPRRAIVTAFPYIHSAIRRLDMSADAYETMVAKGPQYISYVPLFGLIGMLAADIEDIHHAVHNGLLNYV